MALPSPSYFIDSNQTGDEIDFHFVFRGQCFAKCPKNVVRPSKYDDLHPGAKGPAR